MDETTAIIRRGCSLARELEENLGNISSQPQVLSRYCDEIIRVFSHVKDRNSSRDQPAEVASSGGVQEWLQSQPPIDQLIRAQAQFLGSRGTFGVHERTGVVVVPPAGGEREMQAMEVSNASRGSSSSQRQGRRRDEAEKKTVTVPAPQIGNTEIPPEDGYTWRKYGQKDILNSRFPRSYFRCTHKKLYECPAKKQVQRLNDNPNLFEVTYRGDHICHLSSTAPSHLPPPPPAAALHHPPPGPLSHWLSIDIIRPPPPLQVTAAGPAVAGPSTSTAAPPRFIRDYQLPVADMADVMFNSGSSSNNSMDLIFSSIDDHKWDSGEKKN